MYIHKDSKFNVALVSLCYLISLIFSTTPAIAGTISFSGNILGGTCTITNPTINIPLGDHKVTDFSGKGSVLGWYNFNINLNCEANAKVSVKIDATQDPSNEQSVMALDSGDDTADGVGVELWFTNGTGTYVNFGDVQYYNTFTKEGPATIQLAARYHQTKDIMTPGVANATAQFTIIYD
ncbi:fimbrial protein [Lelliottia nimipressuralis]|uniref:Type 1 fimbrial protein n=1 Tax=Lelliottia nimipressuralis TaxID=69220 RepID=A0ABD4KGT5_9ENTR|nr:fimbrial protein [Lelliottia nimipressuralis]MBF4180648.1 type 1 fimbrial protein [Lelliottia nimipressuralis]